MIRPRIHSRWPALIVLAAILGASFAAQAEQPPAAPPPPAEARTAPPARAKPQIIYRLPRSSSYAATLHSQAKTHPTALPIDSNMPTSLQNSRAPANEATARKQQQQQSASKANSSRQQRVKRPKPSFKQPQMRKQSPGKGRGPGFSHGKSRKK